MCQCLMAFVLRVQWFLQIKLAQEIKQKKRHEIHAASFFARLKIRVASN